MRVTFNKTIAFDVDATKGFTPLCPKELPVPGGHEIVDELLQHHKKARFKIFSKDAHGEDAFWIAKPDFPQLSEIEGEPDLDVRWNRHSIVSTYGFQLLDGLPHPREYDFFVYKGAEPDMHPYSAIYHDHAKTISTGIIEWAKQHDCDTFILGGLALNLDHEPMCLGATAIDLAKQDFRIILNLAATRSIPGKGNLEIEKNQFIQMLIKEYDIIPVKNASEIEKFV